MRRLSAWQSSNPSFFAMAPITKPMTIDRWIRFFAGTFVLASLALAHFVSPWFLLMTAFVGVNLFQSSLTNFCPLTYALRALGAPESAAPLAQK
jgi:hypothetical protein